MSLIASMLSAGRRQRPRSSQPSIGHGIFDGEGYIGAMVGLVPAPEFGLGFPGCRGISGFRGVYPMKGKWQAKAKRAGRLYHLGTYATPEEAAQVAHLWRLDNLPGYTGRDIAA